MDDIYDNVEILDETVTDDIEVLNEQDIDNVEILDEAEVEEDEFSPSLVTTSPKKHVTFPQDIITSGTPQVELTDIAEYDVEDVAYDDVDILPDDDDGTDLHSVFEDEAKFIPALGDGPPSDDSALSIDNVQILGIVEDDPIPEPDMMAPPHAHTQKPPKMMSRIVPKPDGSGFIDTKIKSTGKPATRLNFNHFDSASKYTGNEVVDAADIDAFAQKDPHDMAHMDAEDLLDQLDSIDLSQMDDQDLQGSGFQTPGHDDWSKVPPTASAVRFRKQASKKKKKNKKKDKKTVANGGLCSFISPNKYQKGSSSSGDSKSGSSSSNGSSNNDDPSSADFRQA